MLSWHCALACVKRQVKEVAAVAAVAAELAPAVPITNRSLIQKRIEFIVSLSLLV